MQISDFETESTVSQFVSADVRSALSSFLSPQNDCELSDCTRSIAECFGMGEAYNMLAAPLSAERDIQEGKLIHSFRNNTELLVQKTWVEKSDETLKEQVLYRIENLCTSMDEKKYEKSYADFLSLLNDVVYLMFGAQAKKDDFGEYAFRIDPEFGIFWWYITNLPVSPSWPAEKCRTAVLLGMIFLANY